MTLLVSFSVGELSLKGKNKKNFTRALIKDVHRALEGICIEEISYDQGKYYIRAEDADYSEIMNRVKRVFGISSVSLCVSIEKDWEKIKENFKNYVDSKNLPADTTFKVITKRADKNFALNSQEINRELGGVILSAFPELKVEVHNPDKEFFVDIKRQVYFYDERLAASGGLPIGSSGKGIALLSGGIDSPLAFYLMAKRGLKLNAAHFHSYPFTSERAEEKVLELSRIISRYVGGFKVFSVNILPIYEAIRKNTDEKFTTVISRRFMMRISEKVALRGGAGALITGESLGQVASQTLEGLSVTNASVSLPVFRPLIGMDKTEIINQAKGIGTFEKSIEPHDDCCSVFSPKNPITNPKLSDVLREEEKLETDRLISEAIDEMKIISIG